MSNLAIHHRPHRPQPAFVPKRIADILATLGADIQPNWIVRGYVAPRLVTILGAKPKVGKSTLAASLVAVTRDGGEWLGFPVRKCRTLWLDLEMGESQTAGAFKRAGIEDGDLWSWSGHRDGFDEAELRAFIEENHIELLVIDSWSKFSQVEDENNNAKLTKELNTLVRLTRDLDVGILLIHHQKKATGHTIDDLRGGGAIGADADIILNFYRMHEAALANPRRKLVGLGRFMDTTPAEIRVTLRNDRYVLDTVASAPTLPKRQREALNTLKSASDALSYSQWKVATNQSASTFKTALSALVEGGYVRKNDDGEYEVTGSGRAILSNAVE